MGGRARPLPTHYAYAWADLLAADVDPAEMAAGVLRRGLRRHVRALAARRFATKDITS